MRTALAPTLNLATPKVEKFVNDVIIPYFFSSELVRFYECEPGTSDVEDYQGSRWIDGNWGVEILCHEFNTDDIYELDQRSNAIQIGSASVRVKSDKLFVTFWVYARILRH